MSTKAQRDRAEAVQALHDRRANTLPNLTKAFHAEVVQVSRSGMSRQIAVYLPSIRTDTLSDGTTHTTVSVANVSWLVAKATGSRLNRSQDAVVVPGCGMDMRFHLLDCLAHAMGAETAAEWHAGQCRGTFGTY